MWVALAIVLVTSLAVQLAALIGMGGRRPVGDEAAYLEEAAAGGVAAAPPQGFLRPPALPWLAAVCLRAGGSAGAGERLLRLLLGLSSVLTVSLTALAGLSLGGPPVALLAAILLVAQPERILLGCHIWPDSLLALTLAALSIVMTNHATDPSAVIAAGALCALGVLIRVDFLVVPPILLLAWGWSARGASLSLLAILLLPTLVILAALAIRNYLRFGVALPDSTWAFNLTVMAAEARRERRGRFALEPVVAGAHAEWMRLELASGARQGLTALGQTLRSPRRLVSGFVRRLLTLAGPDTFASQNLLPPDAAYPDLGERARRGWSALLRVAFPVLLTLVVVGSVAARRVPAAYAWPALGLLAVAALFNARTRYRVSALPALCLLAADGSVRGLARLSSEPWETIPVLLLALLMLWALLRIDCSSELPAQEHR